MSQDSATLEQLRRQIDRIDDEMHDLLMRRASLVGSIAAAKAPGSINLRPGREAQIIRRLVQRHAGPFPKVALVRIWREIIGAMTSLQAPMPVAVHAPGRSTAAIDVARNHFGLVAPLAAYRSPGQVLRAVTDGKAAVGVIPLAPCAEAADGSEPWWTSLILEGGSAPRVVARLPAAPTQPVKGSAEPIQALVVACRDHEVSGDDRTLLVVDAGPDVSRDRLRAILAAGGLEPTDLLAVHRVGQQNLHLVEVLGFVTTADPRLTALAAAKDPVARIAVAGGYATPLGPEALVQVQS